MRDDSMTRSRWVFETSGAEHPLRTKAPVVRAPGALAADARQRPLHVQLRSFQASGASDCIEDAGDYGDELGDRVLDSFPEAEIFSQELAQWRPSSDSESVRSFRPLPRTQETKPG